MIHFDCPHCKQAITVPDNAQGKQCRCPGCGGISLPAPKPNASTATPLPVCAKTQRFTATPAGSAVLGLFLCVGTVAGLCITIRDWIIGNPAAVEQAAREGAAKEAANRKSDKQMEAWTIAQQFVENRLKSPSTASYGGVLSGDYQNPEHTVVALPNNEYLVAGWVDAQNSFGAIPRSHFSIRLKDHGDAKWSLVGELQLKQR